MSMSVRRGHEVGGTALPIFNVSGTYWWAGLLGEGVSR